MKSLIIVVVFSLFLAPLDLWAQKNVETQHLLWVGYNFKYSPNGKVRFQQEMENRQYWFPFNQHQFLSRTSCQIKLKNELNIGGGFTYFRQSFPQNPYADSLSAKTELRPHLEILRNQSLTPAWQLTNRLSTEFRIFEQDASRYAYKNVRFRYKLEIQYKISNAWKLKAFNEVHLNAGKHIVYNVFDQNRVGVSAIYNVSQRLSVELGYFNWYQQQASGVDFFNRHITRFTVHHTL